MLEFVKSSSMYNDSWCVCVCGGGGGDDEDLP